MDKLEYLNWCMQQLRPSDFVIYQVTKELVGSMLETKEIAQYAGGMSLPTARGCLQRLEKLNFIRYFSIQGQGIHLLWARANEREKPPNTEHMRRHHYGVTLVNAEGRQTIVTYGNFLAFVERNNLNYSCFRAVIAGRKKSHHGWRLVGSPDNKNKNN